LITAEKDRRRDDHAIASEPEAVDAFARLCQCWPLSVASIVGAGSCASCAPAFSVGAQALVTQVRVFHNGRMSEQRRNRTGGTPSGATVPKKRA
jgi:hypothetical protein